MQGGPELFTVWARDVAFKLTRTQLLHDSPNWFTAAFLQHDFMEAESKSAYTDRDPKTVAIIVRYLSGYDILPVEDVFLDTGGLTHAALKADLKKDAIFFGLDRLAKSFTPSFPPFLRQAMNLPGTLKAVEWDEYLYQNDRGVFDGVVVLRDVKLRCVLDKYEGEYWFMLYIATAIPVPPSSAMQNNTPKPAFWIETPTSETNIVPGLDPADITRRETEDLDHSQWELMNPRGEEDLRDINLAKQPINFNGIATNLYDLSRHAAFSAKMTDRRGVFSGSGRGGEQGSSPLLQQAISSYAIRGEADESRGVELYGHEVIWYLEISHHKGRVSDNWR